jgi:hypothetical protein
MYKGFIKKTPRLKQYNSNFIYINIETILFSFRVLLKIATTKKMSKVVENYIL